jgi:hypothetical protein
MKTDVKHCNAARKINVFNVLEVYKLKHLLTIYFTNTQEDNNTNQRKKRSDVSEADSGRLRRGVTGADAEGSVPCSLVLGARPKEAGADVPVAEPAFIEDSEGNGTAGMTASSMSENVTWYMSSACAPAAKTEPAEATIKDARVLQIVFISRLTSVWLKFSYIYLTFGI